MKIGFVGLGNMGTGMANNILNKIENKSDLFVYTRTLEKIKIYFRGSYRLYFDKRNYNFSRRSTYLPSEC